ncbi:MAG TPA: amino acid adenylation domain-containing protein, partial [Longimicrobium sp.]|nr:amino acid adenylation domain-containing protein [Longimicrobium sp.]
ATWTARRAELTAEGWNGRVVCLDRDAAHIRAHAEAAPDEVASPGSVAQLIYTSGSTGSPKGSMIPHRAVPGFMDAYLELAAPGRDDGREVWLQASSVSWDALTLELWVPLLRGACAVLYPPEPGGVSAAGLARQVERHGVNVLFLPPSFFGALLDAAPEAMARARLILVGGEVFPPAEARVALERLPNTRIVNLYGPSECTVAATAYPLPPRAAELGEGAVPLGAPVGDRAVYLVDADMRPVDGEGSGELCIGGPAVARGYLGRPALTAERFVPDPFAGLPGARMYRTGDAVRRTAGGTLHFIGRADRQVKVRGFRVEIGEVEAVLASHPAVRQSAVVAHGSGGARRLAAYASLRDASAGGTGGARVDAAALAEWMRARVPDYEVPSTFTVMDALPLGATHKVDRAALPAPAVESPTSDVEPRTPEEAAVARIWAEVLGVDRVGPDDEFFALGGHSLAAAQVAARVRHELGASLAAADVFAHPTVAGQARQLAASASAPSAAIPRAPRGGDLPLSPGQEAVWFFERLRPGMGSYTFRASIRIDGGVDAEVMARTLTEIVRRHEIYRTTFHEVDGAPVQRIHPPSPVALPRVDLAGTPADEVDARVAETFAAPFDLANGPTVRWALFRLSDAEHILTVHEHHLVHDGWSFALFLRELTALYAAFAEGRPSPLAEPALQWADFAVWQREWLRGDEARGQIEWWRRTLEGVPPSLELPADRPRPEQMSFRGGAHRVRLPRELYAAAEAFGRARGVTPFMTLFAAFQALLHRYTGETDFCVGSAVAARHAPETRDMVGMVVNTIPLRADLSGDPGFGEVLRRVHGHVVQAYAREAVPFAEIVAAAAPDRSAGHLPLYQAVFSFHHAPYPELALPGATLRVEEGLESGWAKLDLNVIVIPRAQQGAGDEVVMIWEFAEDLFDAATIRRMIGHWQALLAGALADPDLPVSRLPITPADEGRRLRLLAGAPTPYPRDATVHELFVRQARRTPGAVAVQDDGGTMTYAELDAASARLARRLRTLGAGAESRVAVAVERSAAMVTAFLAALRAGAAYVPLDPSHPAERLEYVLEQSGASVLVVRDAVPPSLAGWAGAVARVDDSTSSVDDDAGAFASPVAMAESLACVLYTSGSTGRPKGVAIVHHGIVRVVKDADYLQLGPADVVAQVTTPSFDVSLWEIWGALLNGARLVVIGREEILSPATFVGRLRGDGVTALFLTPTGLRQVVAEIPDAFAGVKTLLLGGEALEGPVLRRVLEAGPPGRMLNAYGPTESTTYASWHPVEAVAAGALTVPIGRPVSNTTLWVLDAALRPAPLGVPGELYIGGDGVARGYLGRPALTAERFVPDPYSGHPGARMYRTGDRARWRANGELEYLGRLDQQVKVRGFRVEPGEIEAVLRAHPAVRDAAVVPRDDGGERWLAAYVSTVDGPAPAHGAAGPLPRPLPALRGGRGNGDAAAGAEVSRVDVARGDSSVAGASAGDGAASEGAGGGGETVDAAALRAWCAERLPAWMVPGAFTVLDALPQTPSGKLDRRALPDPGGPAPAAGWEAPATPTEREVAAIWSEVLGVERVGATDDLFDLGGHSLKATRILTRIGARLGVQLPVGVIFEHPTVRGLATLVDARLAAALAGDPDEALLTWLETLTDEEAERLLDDAARA